jgi:hypothetical protein
VNSTLHASISGKANDAPLPLIEPANAGEAERINEDVARIVIATFLLNFMKPPS